jgi:2-keto-4-pentenoate hydratase/2-oxohepta-3-ene-1,7-dioic acid hydratase in catechol pathway
MKLARFKHNSAIKWGKIENDSIFVLKGLPFKRIELTGETLSFDKIKILPPSRPSKIILVGLNYKDHAEELNMKIPDEPIIFLKPPSSIIADGENIVYPDNVQRVDYEAELALIIKKKAKNIKEKEFADYVLGYTSLNDITARDIQKEDGQWTRGKSFDTFCPVGPCLETDINPSNLQIKAILNGKVVQNSNTNNFIFGVDYLVSFISRIMTLLPGDIISTGTPKGVGRMKRKDTIEIEIEKIGKLANTVV